LSALAGVIAAGKNTGAILNAMGGKNDSATPQNNLGVYTKK
jgi:hypothetical protein